MTLQTIQQGGIILVLLVGVAALIVVLLFERFIFFHRQYTSCDEFLRGVRTVLKRGNVVEALSICEATPGPVAHLVKYAILNRSRSTEQLQNLLYVTSLSEILRLEEKLGALGTLVKVAPLLGFWGVILGLMDVFQAYMAVDSAAQPDLFASGIGKALVCGGFGVAISIPGRIGYEYLIQRLQRFVVEIEKCCTEIVVVLNELS